MAPDMCTVCECSIIGDAGGWHGPSDAPCCSKECARTFYAGQRIEELWRVAADIVGAIDSLRTGKVTPGLSKRDRDYFKEPAEAPGA